MAACSSSDNGSSSPIVAAKLVINEVQPANKDTVTDDQGEADDWIEVYNADATTVDLIGWVVSDSGTRQVLPSALPILPGGYALLWADDSPAQGVAHLGFKLSAKKGDTVTLTSPSGAVVDTVTFGVAVDSSSYARLPNGTGAFAWCATPTPGAVNGSACGVP